MFLKKDILYTLSAFTVYHLLGSYILCNFCDYTPDEDQARNKTCPSSSNDLGEDLKQQLVFQDSPKDILSDPGFKEPPLHTICYFKIVLNNHSSVRSSNIIHQIKIITNSNGKQAEMWIKDLNPIFYTCKSFSMENK